MFTKAYGHQLSTKCRTEPGNIQDPHAVAMIKGLDVVGHVPRKISTMCSMFLRRVGSTIVCTVTGPRRHSVDLVQGGLEVPCKYLFTGDEVLIEKLKRLLPSDIQFSSDEAPKQNVTSIQIKMEPKMDIDIDIESDQLVWVKYGSCSLSLSDKKSLKDGNDLNDMHINFGQNLIKKTIPCHKWIEVFLDNHKTQLPLPRR